MADRPSPAAIEAARPAIAALLREHFERKAREQEAKDAA